MKHLVVAFSILTSMSLFGADDKSPQKINMSFVNEELIKIIEIYAKASGQKIMVDPSVRGKISIFLPEPVTIEEAFNQLSSALAINGYSISKQLDTLVIKSSRNIQRDLIEVSTALPSLKPERMYTWIYKPKYLLTEQISRELRILNSKDGELSPYPSANLLIMTDYVSNIHRVAELLKELDKPVDPATAKMVETYKKESAARSAIFAREAASRPPPPPNVPSDK